MIVIGVGGVLLLKLLLLVRGLLGLHSGNASSCCWGALLRTGQLSPRLTRRLWRILIWHWWLTGSPVPGSVKSHPTLHCSFCPAPWPHVPACPHIWAETHRWTTDRRNSSHFFWHLWGWMLRVMLLDSSLFDIPCRKAKRGGLLWKNKGKKEEIAENCWNWERKLTPLLSNAETLWPLSWMCENL